MKKEHVDLENGLVHIADSKTANGIGDMPLTQAAREAFRRQGGNAGERISVPQPETRNGEAVYDQSAQSLGRDAEESGSTVFCSLRTSAHVRYQVERWRRRRSHGDADVETERCGGIQAVQSGQARNDARGARQTGSAGKRERNFVHRKGELNDFMHIIEHKSLRVMT